MPCTCCRMWWCWAVVLLHVRPCARPSETAPAPSRLSRVTTPSTGSLNFFCVALIHSSQIRPACGWTGECMRAGRWAAQVDPAILAAVLRGGGEPNAPAALVLEDAHAPCVAGAQLLPPLRPVAPHPNLRPSPHALHRSFVTACSPCEYFDTACAVRCSSM